MFILAKQTIEAQQVEMVNARDLHTFLEVGRVFAAWIQDRVDQYGFIENQDYVVFSEIGNNPLGGRPIKEYHLTLAMAKELSMVERNAKGKEARQYFIECEKQVKQPTRNAIPVTPNMEAGLLAPVMVEAMKAFGFVGNHAVLSANKAVKAVTNVDLLALSGNTHLIADKKTLTFTPTELGTQLTPPASARGG